ncbi:MAG: hypothetical protein HGA31_00120 [Candidatus Moranbacteria bacterium]|nr:hypothetical protein [Candidatus Moranbacteria bacterium]
MKRLLHYFVVVLLLGGMATVMNACAKAVEENQIPAPMSQDQQGGRWESVPDQLHGKRVLVVMRYGSWDIIGGALADQRLKSAVETATGQEAVLNRDTERYYETRFERMEKSRFFVPYGMMIGYLYLTDEGEYLRVGPTGNSIADGAAWERKYFDTGNPN